MPVNPKLRGRRGQVGVSHQESAQGGEQLSIMLRIVFGQAADRRRAPGSEGLGYSGF